MSILDNLLGGSSGGTSASESSSSLDATFGTAPALGLQTSDVLSFEASDDNSGVSSSFTGIGDLGLGLSAPTVLGVSASNETADVSEGDGGLLGGLL